MPKKEKRKPSLMKKVRKPGFCAICKEGAEVSYKDILLLKRFTTTRGKIIPRKVSGICASHQRKLGGEIKIARFLALLPFTERHAI